MARTYAQNKQVPPRLIPVPSLQPMSDELKPWKDGVLLHSLKQISEILTNDLKLGRGYSYDRIRRLIGSGVLPAGVWFYDGSYKVNIHRFLEWRNRNPDDRALKRR